jgi:hypothetical protein
MPKMNSSYQVIEYPEAYADATKARIIANANKTFAKNHEDIESIEAFLSKGVIGNVNGRKIYSENFVGSLASAYHKYGKLSEKQVEIIRKLVAENQARKEAYLKALDEQKAKSAFVGVENEKVMVTVKVVKVLRMSASSFSYYDRASQEMYIMKDEADNTYVYRTKSIFQYKFAQKQVLVGMPCEDMGYFVKGGMTINIQATVKAHVEYKGEKQTIITRPKILGMEWVDSELKDLVDLQDK